MNKHIELVKKWLANPDSVTQDELNANATAARTAAYAAAYADTCAAYTAARDFARDAARVSYWVKEYEEINDE